MLAAQTNGQRLINLNVSVLPNARPHAAHPRALLWRRIRYTSRRYAAGGAGARYANCPFEGRLIVQCVTCQRRRGGADLRLNSRLNRIPPRAYGAHSSGRRVPRNEGARVPLRVCSLPRLLLQVTRPSTAVTPPWLPAGRI